MKLQQGNVFTGICQPFCSQGGGADTPWADTPWQIHPHADPPGWHHMVRHPPAWYMLGYTPPVQCMLGYNPRPMHAGIHTPCLVHAGIHTPAQCMLGFTPPADTAVDGKHPTGMHSCSLMQTLLVYLTNKFLHKNMYFSVIIWVTEPYFKFLSYKLVACIPKNIHRHSNFWIMSNQ